MSESAHLIWKLRNARVINDELPPSSQAIRGKWVAAMNSRLSLDCLSTNQKFGARAISINKVKWTWQEVLWDQKNLPENWIWETGVVVGIRAGIG